MKQLHILKTPPDDNTIQLIEQMKESGGEDNLFKLFAEDINYDELIEQIFDHDRVISW